MPVFDVEFSIFRFSIFDFRSAICDLNMMPEDVQCREDETETKKKKLIQTPFFHKKNTAFPCIPLDNDTWTCSGRGAARRCGNIWGLKFWRGEQGGWDGPWCPSSFMFYVRQNGDEVLIRPGGRGFLVHGEEYLSI